MWSVVERLERTQWDPYWAPSGVRVLDRPDVKALIGPEDSYLLNYVVRTRGDPARCVDLVQPLHRGCSRWLVVPPGPAFLPRELRRAGYAQTFEGYGYAIDPRHWVPRRPTRGHRAVKVRELRHLFDWYAVSAAAFSRPVEWIESPRLLLDACTAPGTRTHRWVVYDADDRPVSAGGLNVYSRLELGFLWAGGTVPDGRGKGAYSALLEARIRFAHRIGLTAVGLYANRSTSAPIVAAHGFERHGTMAYFERGA